MTGNNFPVNQSPSTERSQNAGSKHAGIRNKIGRVSQRRELAAVTLGAVAAITGLGGVLAANPPSWARTGANAQPSITTQATTTSSQSASSREGTIRVVTNTKNKESASAKEAPERPRPRRPPSDSPRSRLRPNGRRRSTLPRHRTRPAR